MENPRRQEWDSVVMVLAKEMKLPIIPYEAWLRKLQQEDHDAQAFLYGPDFLRVGLGKIALDIEQAQRVSQHLRDAKPIGEHTLITYVAHHNSHKDGM